MDKDNVVEETGMMESLVPTIGTSALPAFKYYGCDSLSLPSLYRSFLMEQTRMIRGFGEKQTLGQQQPKILGKDTSPKHHLVCEEELV